MTSNAAAAKPTNADLRALQQYVTAQDGSYQHLHPTTVLLDLTHSNLVQKHIEIRFDKHASVQSLRTKIHQTTGTPPAMQHLQFLENGVVRHEIPPSTSDHYKLGYFGVQQYGTTVHCVDLDPHSGSRNGQYEDTSLVQKYKMSDETYDQRQGTLRDWQRTQQQQDATFTLKRHGQRHQEMVEARRCAKLGLPLPAGYELCQEENGQTEVRRVVTETKDKTLETHDETSVAHVTVGRRCQVQPGGRRGRVAYVGPACMASGQWVGVQFDEPVGSNNGSIVGKNGTTHRYFQAPLKYGGFCRGKNVQVGDFPERSLDDDELEEDSSEDEL